MLKIFVAEDEPKIRESILHIVENYIPDTIVSAYAQSVNDALLYLQKNEVDLLLLDINFPDGTAFDILNNLNSINFKIIFITAFEKYALQAIKCSASDYLLKPINPKELIEAVQKVKEKTIPLNTYKDQINVLLSNLNNINNPTKKIVLKTGERILVINSCDIIRCESDGSYTLFFIHPDKKILISKSLSEYEELLQDHNFIRVHKSHLVNIDQIESFEKSYGGFLIMKNKSQVPVSVRRKDFLIKALDKLNS
jgi:two-component system LytT family response regulator